jgi:hypothetical protein
MRSVGCVHPVGRQVVRHQAGCLSPPPMLVHLAAGAGTFDRLTELVARHGGRSVWLSFVLRRS